MAETKTHAKNRRQGHRDHHRQRHRQSVELPVLSGTVGPKVIDIRKLYGELDMFTFDPGYTSTGSCESKITYIDGDEGVLLYRGYPIEQLAEHSDFMEVAYLLLNGELPTADEKKKFVRDITLHTMVHEQLASVPPRLPPRCASDGGDVRRGRRAVGLLSRLDRHQRSAPAHGRVLPPDRQDADDGGDGVQIFDRPAASSTRRTSLAMPKISCT